MPELDREQGWWHRRIEPRPVEVWIDGKWIAAWLTDVARAPDGTEWGYGRGIRLPWNRWVERRRIRPVRRT